MKSLLLGLLCLLLAPGMYANTLYPLPTQQQTQQFDGLLKALRCLVCQNQDLADSHAELANDLRKEVYERVKAGESDTQILNYLSQRYGDFILFKPPVKALTALLWFAPAVLILLGLILVFRLCRKRGSGD